MNSGRTNSIQHNYNDGFDFDPLKSPNLRVIKKPPSKPPSVMSSSQNSIDTNAHTTQDEIVHDDHDDDAVINNKEIGQLAMLFLQVRKGIMNDCNYDVSHNERLDQEREYYHNQINHNQSITKRVSKSTLHRAEMVKLMFNLYYFSLFQAQKVTNPEYANVDGVYNPLQIIRNRTLRKKYRQPPQISVKTLPMASTAFSKHKRKFIWEIELAELIHDFNWRSQHWNELINPNGELWFPSRRKRHDNHHHHHHQHLHRGGQKYDQNKEVSPQKNIHDKLFEIDSGDDHDHDHDHDHDDSGMDQSQILNGSGKSDSTSNRSSREDLSDSSNRRKRDRIANKIRSKSPFKRKNDLLVMTSPNPKETPNNFKTDIFLSPSASKSHNILGDINIEHIRPHERNISDDKLIGGSQSSGVNEIHEDINIDELQQNEDLKLLNSYFKEMRYLDTVINFSPHDYEYKKLEYINLLKKKQDFDSIYNEISYNVLDKLRSGVSKDYESFLKSKSDDLRSIRNELINEYSTKIDKMLTLSDRTIGEVNTTLSLEIRKLTERVEKIGGPVNKRSDSLINFLYWLLENLVVLIFWCIWIGFSFGKVIKYLVLIVWGIVKWVMF